MGSEVGKSNLYLRKNKLIEKILKRFKCWEQKKRV